MPVADGGHTPSHERASAPAFMPPESPAMGAIRGAGKHESLAASEMGPRPGGISGCVGDVIPFHSWFFDRLRSGDHEPVSTFARCFRWSGKSAPELHRRQHAGRTGPQRGRTSTAPGVNDWVRSRSCAPVCGVAGLGRVGRRFRRRCAERCRGRGQHRSIPTARGRWGLISYQISPHLLYQGVGAPSRTRTCDLRIRSPLLYPAELWGPFGGRYARRCAARRVAVGRIACANDAATLPSRYTTASFSTTVERATRGAVSAGPRWSGRRAARPCPQLRRP